MEIQPITKANIEACAKTFIQSYNQPPWNYQWTLESAIKYLNEYALSAQFVGFALYDNEDIAGAVLAHSKTWWTSNQLFIDELFVSPNFQKMGCGKRLMDCAEQYALEHELKTITLMTHKFMPAMSFYSKNDFIHAQPFVILFKAI